jgi:ketosteroid isomerase-like protein
MMRAHAPSSHWFAWAAMLAMPAAGTATAAAQDIATQAPAGHSAVAQIEQVERDWLAALRNDDRAALGRILADDFTDISVHGEVRHKAEAVAHRVAPDTVQHVHDLQVRVYADTAVATGINTVHSRAQGWSVDVAFTDVFVHRHGRWQAVSAQETLRNGGSR